MNSRITGVALDRQSSVSPVRAYAFLDFTLDIRSERLLRGTSEIKLRPKSFHVLRYLVEHPGRLVTRDELMQDVWGDVVVSDESVTKCIADVRKALADESQQIIRTVTRRGFLMEAQVQVVCNTTEDPPGIPSLVPPSPHVRHGLLYVLIGAVLVLSGVALLPSARDLFGSRRAFEAIAVLPFESLSSGTDQQYLADGMTEALITNLGQASPLRVIARTSVGQYQKARKPIREIGRELGVDVVVEGTLTQLNDRIRVTANLIQVSPEKHLWARSYERKFGDALTLQDEIADAISREIHGRVTPNQQRRASGRRSVNPEAQLARWKARYFRHHRRTPEAAKKSLEYADQAVRLDPNSAGAHAELAFSYVMLTYMGVTIPGGAKQAAKAAAERAVSLDENLPEAHDALGQVQFLYDHDFESAERAHQQALKLNPSDADARLHLANCLAARGRVEEAVTEIKRARQHDPLSFLINREVGRMLYYARRYDEALAELKQAADMQPDSSVVD